MELKRLKKMVILGSLVLSVPIFIIAPFEFLLKINVFKILGLWDLVRNFDDPLLFLLASPVVVLSLSIPFYFTCTRIYLAWLVWTGICIWPFAWLIDNYNPSDWFADSIIGMFGTMYTGVSLLLLLINLILHIRYKRRIQQA